jgi:processive 1,2-diacylglycerol beta-glucosyltransferase
MLIIPFSLRKINKKIKTVNPDGIIATSFLSAYFAMYWRKFLVKKYKVYGVLVDFYPSPMWYISIDKIFVANDLSKNILKKNTGKSTSIYITGIPNPIKYKQQILPLNQRKEILLTGGGWGLGPILEITNSLLSMDQIGKINVICGDNQSLKNQLETKFSKDIQNNRLKVLGLINNIEEYYKNTRILISKAGGITLTEVPFFEIPMIITYAITGSEIKNRKYFAENDACLLANTPDEIRKNVNELLKNEEKSKKIIQNAKKLVYPDSTDKIIKTILEDFPDG